MSILQITTDVTGQVGYNPRRVKIISTDNLSTVTTAGYLNNISLQGYSILPTDIIDMWYGYESQSNPGTYDEFLPSISNGVITLSLDVNEGNVALPVIDNHFAVFNGTTGQIKSDAATAINSGNIQAGLSGTAGTLASFPATASKGSLKIAAVANTGDTVTTISNAAMGQATTITIPDPGAASANAILSASAGTQTISTGNLTLSAGNVTVTAGTITTTNGGVIQSGSSGQAGSLKVFPATASKGDLKITCADQTGNTEVVLTTASMGQASTITLPDPGDTSANILLTKSFNKEQFVTGNLTLNENSVVCCNVIEVDAATLNSNGGTGKVNVFVAPYASSRICILDIKVLASPGGGLTGVADRTLYLTDGTTVFNGAGISDALLATPVFTAWGSVPNPYTGSSTTSFSVAGQNVYFQYGGGSVNFTGGSLSIAVTYVQFQG